MNLPEDVKELFKGDFLGVVEEFDSFGMACRVCADFFVGGVFVLWFAASVADFGFYHSFRLVEDFFNAPEAACGEGGFFKLWIEFHERMKI